MNRKSRKTKLFLTILISIFLLTGCVEPEIIDEINIITGFGYDLEENNKIKGTALFPAFMPDGMVKNVTLTATNEISGNVIIEMQRKSPNPLVAGSLEIVLFGREFASERGIFRIVDTLQRDPSVGARIYLVVSDGTAEEILQEQLGGEGTGEYLSSLIYHNIRGKDLPKTNLHLFSFSYHQEGRDPYLPIMKRLGEKDITISGVAIFKGDKVIYDVPDDKMLYFKLLVDRYGKGSLSSRDEHQESTMRIVGSNTKYSVEKTNETVEKIRVQIKIDAIVVKYYGKKLTPKEIEHMEKDFSDNIKRECTELLKTFQELGVDPAGLGREVRRVTYGFDVNKWESQYPNVEITVDPEITITQTGVVE